MLDDPANIALYATWLRTEARPSIEGHGGNNNLAAAGAMGSSYGLSQETTCELILEHFNPRCIPEWSWESVKRYGGSGYRSASSQFGNMAAKNPKLMFTAAAEARKVEAEQKAAGVKVEPAVRYDQLVQRFSDALSARGGRELCGQMFGDIELDLHPEWIIRNWLPKGGVVALVGESGSFKTYVAVNMLGCKATGTPWAGREGFAGYPVGEAAPVAMFAGEMPKGVLRRIHIDIEGNKRDRALVKKHLLFVKTVYALNRPDGLAGMAMEIEKHGIRPAIIAVDTFNLALDGNEDTSEEVKKALAGARALAEMFDAVVVIVDHTGHGDQTRARGSSAKKANEDGVILCKRDGKGDTVTLTQGKNREGAEEDFKVSLKSQKVQTGTHPDTGEPITELWFEAVAPKTKSATAEPVFSKDAGKWALYDAAAKKHLDSHAGPDIKASDLARQAVRAAAVTDFESNDPGKFAEEVNRYRQHVVGEPSFRRYVASRTGKGDASTFRNPNASVEGDDIPDVRNGLAAPNAESPPSSMDAGQSTAGSAD